MSDHNRQLCKRHERHAAFRQDHRAGISTMRCGGLGRSARVDRSRHRDCARRTWTQLKNATKPVLCRRLARPGPQAGRAHRHLVIEPRRMGANSVRRGEGRPDSGHDQSRLSPDRAGLRAGNLVGCAALVTATQFKTSDYLGMLNTLAPELAAADARRAQSREAAASSASSSRSARREKPRPA